MMGANLQIDVGTLNVPQRRALEEVIGRELAANQRLTISITDVPAPPSAAKAPQSLEDWIGVYEGLSNDEVEEIDKIIKTRANLTRPLP